MRGKLLWSGCPDSGGEKRKGASPLLGEIQTVLSASGLRLPSLLQSVVIFPKASSAHRCPVQNLPVTSYYLQNQAHIPQCDVFHHL